MQAGFVTDTQLRVVKRGGSKKTVPSERRVLSRDNGGLPETEFRSLAERVAGHRLYQRGVFFQQLRDAFPADPRMWVVDRYFPYSKHGPIYIDEPVLDHQVEESKRKAAVLKKIGHTLIVLGQKTTYADAMEQLSEAPECPGHYPKP